MRFYLHLEVLEDLSGRSEGSRTAWVIRVDYTVVKELLWRNERSL
jgi:hypothetical protein